MHPFIDLLKVEYPTHEIVIFSDLNTTLLASPEAQIRLFREADIAIGFHGAGLTNTMYMRPGSLVVEVIGFFDSRIAPMIGIFPRLSGIIGLHHYTWYFDGQGIYNPYPGIVLIDPNVFVKDIVTFHKKSKLWEHK
jgi:hypothetical protein